MTEKEKAKQTVTVIGIMFQDMEEFQEDGNYKRANEEYEDAADYLLAYKNDEIDFSPLENK